MLMYKENCVPVDVSPASVCTMQNRGWAVTPTKQPAKKIKAKPNLEVNENGDN